MYIGSSLRLRTSEIGVISAGMVGLGWSVAKMVVEDDSQWWRRVAGAAIGFSAGTIVGSVVEEATAFGLFRRMGPILIGGGVGGLAGFALLPPLLEPEQALFGAVFGMIEVIADFVEKGSCTFLGPIGEIPSEYQYGSMIASHVTDKQGNPVQKWDDFLDGILKLWPGKPPYELTNGRARLAGILVTRCDGANKLFGDVGGNWVLHAGHIPTVGNNEYMVTAGGVHPGWKVAAKYGTTPPQAFVQTSFFKEFVKPFECDIFTKCPPGTKLDSKTDTCVKDTSGLQYACARVGGYWNTATRSCESQPKCVTIKCPEGSIAVGQGPYDCHCVTKP